MLKKVRVVALELGGAATDTGRLLDGCERAEIALPKEGDGSGAG